MILTEDDTILKFWVATVPKFTADFLCIVARSSTGEIKGEYRFRYHVAPGFQKGDRISRYQLVSVTKDPNPEELFTAVRTLLSTDGFVDIVEIDVNGNFNKLFALLADVPGWGVQLTRQELNPEKSNGN